MCSRGGHSSQGVPQALQRTAAGSLGNTNSISLLQAVSPLSHRTDIQIAVSKSGYPYLPHMQTKEVSGKFFLRQVENSNLLLKLFKNHNLN